MEGSTGREKKRRSEGGRVGEREIEERYGMLYKLLLREMCGSYFL